MLWRSIANMNVRKLAESASLGTILTVCSLAQSPVAAQKGTVSGTVTNTAGAPLRRVSLRLTPQPISFPAAPASILATETDSQGNFTFDEVAPGRYLLGAQRAGYQSASYDNGRGRVLTVQPGQKTTDIVIKMTPKALSEAGSLMRKTSRFRALQSTSAPTCFR